MHRTQNSEISKTDGLKQGFLFGVLGVVILSWLASVAFLEKIIARRDLL
ncbi:MAG TPA: hypothetical protein VJ873_09235 [bacterium]|nr:hypothetical protein [bacterium]